MIDRAATGRSSRRIAGDARRRFGRIGIVAAAIARGRRDRDDAADSRQSK